MGSGASKGLAAAVRAASVEDLSDSFKGLAAEDVRRLREALAAGEPAKKPAGGPPPMEKLDRPFGAMEETVAVDIKDDPTHKVRFEDDEGCVRVYEPYFDKPGQMSKVHYHDQFTAYLFLGNPDEAMTESAMEVCQETEGGIKGLMAVKMPAFPCGFCSCLFFPHPQFGPKAVHRVGIPASFSGAGSPFHQLGCEVKAWPKDATPEALPPKPAEGPSLPAPYAVPGMAPETTKFRTWRLELRPGSELPAHAFAFPAMVLCGCGGGGALRASEDGPSDSPLLGLKKGDYRWLPTGCAKVGPLQLPTDAAEPFVVAVIELLKEGLL